MLVLRRRGFPSFLLLFFFGGWVGCVVTTIDGGFQNGRRFLGGDLEVVV